MKQNPSYTKNSLALHFLIFTLQASKKVPTGRLMKYGRLKKDKCMGVTNHIFAVYRYYTNLIKFTNLGHIDHTPCTRFVRIGNLICCTIVALQNQNTNTHHCNQKMCRLSLCMCMLQKYMFPHHCNHCPPYIQILLMEKKNYQL